MAVELTRLIDFGLWFGKSVFDGISAETIHKDHSGHTALTLIVCEAICNHTSRHALTICKDVLERVVAIYCPDSKRAHKEQTHSQKTLEAFYRSIHDHRCDMSEAEWEAFRQRLSSDVATSCNRIRDAKVPELHGISLSTPSKTAMVSNPTIGTSNKTSSSISPHQRSSTESLSEMNPTSHSQPVLQPLVNSAPAPMVAVLMQRYTCVLNEHAALQGEKLTYEKKHLSLDPSSWQCSASFGGISGVGTGRNIAQAKHEASRQVCQLLNLTVL
jgi:hypothetical protein